MSSPPVAVMQAASEPALPAAQSASQAAPGSAAPTAEPLSRAVESPVDVVERTRFNDEAREFFEHAASLSPAERASKARQLAAELQRLERAGGLSAGEIFLLRAGLIRETVSDPAQQVAQITALKERYESESRRRLAEANARSDPAFDSYKVRESQIVAEVMVLETIPNGLTRDEYLRRRLQAAREQLMP